MVVSRTQWFFGLQFVVWSALALVTRLSWFDQNSVPPWTNLLLYSALGFIISTGLGAAFIRLAKRKAMEQLVGSSVLTISAAFLWRASFNAIEYHVLQTANNTYEFWGYFHYGRMTVFQLALWAAAFWMAYYYLQVQKSAGTIQKIDAEQNQRAAELKNEHGAMHPKGIAVRDGKTTRWIDPETIESVVSARDYLCIKIDTDILIHRATMKKFAETLPAYFIRCHRSHFVNVDFISSIKSEDDQTSILTSSGAKHPVSRRYKSEVRSRLAARA